MKDWTKQEWFKYSAIGFCFLALFFFSWIAGEIIANKISGFDSEEEINDTAIENDESYNDVVRFETEIFDFVNDELELFLIEEKTDKENFFAGDETLNDSYDIEKHREDVPEDILNKLGREALAKIDAYQEEQEYLLSDSLLQRLEKLRLNIAMRILLDKDLSEKIISRLANDVEKIGVLSTYASFFTKGNRSEVRSFLLQQADWAGVIDPDYEKNIQLVLFNSDPIGQKLPNYFRDVLGTKNQSLDFSNFEEKYLLIDFWASWCLPCIEELPYIKEMYNRYFPRQFDIIGVSLDTDREAFELFLERYKLTWNQYFDGKAFQGELIKNYGIFRLPSKYMIDPEGIVISANIHAEEMLEDLINHIENEKKVNVVN